jgi:VanZ family protein
MLSRNRKKIVYLIPIFLFLGIFLMSSLPASALPAKIPDIIPHFCEYALLAFFFIQIFSKPTQMKTMAIGLAWLILLGFSDELHQAFVPSRVCSLQDLLFDTLGSLFGLLAYLKLRRWTDKRQTSKWARRLGNYLFHA